MSKKAHSSPPMQLRGRVIAFNVSPKGYIEGALVETTNGPAQLNFPKHGAEALARSMHVGSRIDLEAEFETEDHEHPVYESRDEDAEVRGTIARLNYALQGEVNGYHLRDGTFIHVKPDGAKKYKLHVGDKVKATGSRRTGADAIVLEARAMERLGKRRETARA